MIKPLYVKTDNSVVFHTVTKYQILLSCFRPCLSPMSATCRFLPGIWCAHHGDRQNEPLFFKKKENN